MLSAIAFQSTMRLSRPTATIPSAMFARIAAARSRSSATLWNSSALAIEADAEAASAASDSSSSSRHDRGVRAYTASTP